MSDRRMKTLFLRMAAVALGALVVGIIVNAYHPRGIRWEILKLSLPWTSDDGWSHVSADSAFSMFLGGDATFIDVRSRDDYRLDHIQGALSLPFFEDFTRPELLERLDAQGTIILYDLERNASAPRLIARYLARKEFVSVHVIRGGYIEWLDMTFPVETGIE